MDVEAHVPLFVPVHKVNCDVVVPEIAHLPLGPRAGLAFTTVAALLAACPPGQPWIRLSEEALRELLVPLGITRIQVDPVLVSHA